MYSIKPQRLGLDRVEIATKITIVFTQVKMI